MLEKIWPGLAWFFFTAILLFMPGKDLPAANDWMEVVYFDKWVHAGIFAMLVFLWLYPVRKLNSLRKLWVMWVLSLAFTWAMLSETIQHFFIKDRQFDIFDIIADCAGILVGWWIFKKFSRKATFMY